MTTALKWVAGTALVMAAFAVWLTLDVGGAAGWAVAGGVLGVVAGALAAATAPADFFFRSGPPRTRLGMWVPPLATCGAFVAAQLAGDRAVVALIWFLASGLGVAAVGASFRKDRSAG